MSQSTHFRRPFAVADDRAAGGKIAATVDEGCLSVLFVGAYAPPVRGSRGVSEDLCAQLNAAGLRMQIVSQRTSRMGRFLEMLWTAWHQRKTYQVAAVDLYSGLAFHWARAVCWVLRKVGKPYVLMLHGGNLPLFASRNPELVQKLLRSAAAVTTPSAYLLEQMQAYAPSILLLPNAIEIERYKFKSSPTGAPHLIWLRAFHEVYNPVLAVQALALLARDFPDIRLTMIGPDKGDGSLQKTMQAAERLGVTDRLTILGPVRKEEVPNALAAGNLFLNTARIDNTPVSVMEAMACGLPVVSTNVGGIPYLIENEEEALLVLPDNSERLAEAVRRIIVDPVLARRLVQRARRKAEQWDWSKILPRWEALFGQVANAGDTSVASAVSTNKNASAA